MGLTLLLRDDPAVIARYKQHHAEAWPEVIAALHNAGVAEMKIFLIGRRLFMYLVVPDEFDPAVEWPKLSADPVYARWDELMASMQERAPEAKPDEWWASMELVFSLSPEVPSSAE